MINAPTLYGAQRFRHFNGLLLRIRVYIYIYKLKYLFSFLLKTLPTILWTIC